MQAGSLIVSIIDYHQTLRDNPKLHISPIVPDQKTILTCKSVEPSDEPGKPSILIEETDVWFNGVHMGFNPDFFVEVQPPIDSKEIAEVINECQMVEHS